MTAETTIFDQRALLKVTGSEANSLLNRILTCNLTQLSEEQALYGALLTPQGKILTDLFIIKGEDCLWMDLPTETLADTKKRLTMLKLRADVQLEAAEDFAIAFSDSDIACIASGRDPRFSSTYLRSVVLKEDAAGVSMADYAKLRHEAITPECGLDYAPGTCFPADVNLDLIGGVDYKKGCFVGQEVASRMKRKAEVRKRACRIEANISGAEAEMPVMAGESTIGEILSWEGKTGLALIRLDRLKAAEERGDTPTIQSEACSVHAPEPQMAAS